MGEDENVDINGSADEVIDIQPDVVDDSGSVMSDKDVEVGSPIVILYPYIPPPFLGADVTEARSRQDSRDVLTRFFGQYYTKPENNNNSWQSRCSPYVTSRTPSGKPKVKRTEKSIDSYFMTS